MPDLSSSADVHRAGCRAARSDRTSQYARFRVRGQISWSVEGLDARLGAAEYQRMDVMRALIGIDRFQIQNVTDHIELVGDTVAAMHVAGCPRDVERLAAIVALHQRDRFRCGLPLIHQPAETQRAQKTERDFRLNV